MIVVPRAPTPPERLKHRLGGKGAKAPRDLWGLQPLRCAQGFGLTGFSDIS